MTAWSWCWVNEDGWIAVRLSRQISKGPSYHFGSLDVDRYPARQLNDIDTQFDPSFVKRKSIIFGPHLGTTRVDNMDQ